MSNDLFIESVNCANKGDLELATHLLKRAINFNKENLDALESLAVIYGNDGKYKKAHFYLDKILELEPDHIMAHTNRSLYIMKEGKIEEAEKAKDISLKLSLVSVEDSESESEKRKNRMEMFLEVLSIDPRDDLSLAGLISIFLEEDNFYIFLPI